MRGTNDQRELLKRAKAGDIRAFEELVLLNQDRVYNVILKNVGDRELASDICQDVFVQAFKVIGDYDDRAQFSTWLFRVAMNTIVSHHRHASAQKRGGGQSPLSLGDDNTPDPGADARTRAQTTPDEEAMRDETHARVLSAIESLEPDYRAVVVLRDIEGLSYEEVCETLDINKGTVRSRLHRARERLREILADLVSE